MIGKPLSALEDARTAVSLDSKFIRAVVRIATCHLRSDLCESEHNYAKMPCHSNYLTEV
jgi:hypothetical protein